MTLLGAVRGVANKKYSLLKNVTGWCHCIVTCVHDISITYLFDHMMNIARLFSLHYF